MKNAVITLFSVKKYLLRLPSQVAGALMEAKARGEDYLTLEYYASLDLPSEQLSCSYPVNLLDYHNKVHTVSLFACEYGTNVFVGYTPVPPAWLFAI